jgi:hypothetical protein
MTSATELTSNSACTRVVLRVKPPCTGRCDRLSVCLDKLPLTRSSRPLGINLQPLATMLPLSMERRVQVFLRAWLSMLPQTATHTTVPIVTAAVIPNLPTDKTPKCTSKVISGALRATRYQRHYTKVCLINQCRSHQKHLPRHFLTIR